MFVDAEDKSFSKVQNASLWVGLLTFMVHFSYLLAILTEIKPLDNFDTVAQDVAVAIAYGFEGILDDKLAIAVELLDFIAIIITFNYIAYMVWFRL